MGFFGSIRDRRSLALGCLAALALSVLSAVCNKAPTQPSPGSPTPVPGPTPSPPLPSGPGPVVFAGAGDIAIADGHDADTAHLLDLIGGDIFTLGDNAYPNGSADNFKIFDRSWGRFRGPRMHPAPGNHEYNTPGGTDYFQYFGDLAGTAGRGYYSFDLGAWHIVSLNSNFDFGVGVDASSPQGVWLKDDLSQHTSMKCTLAYWHHPLFSSGRGGDNLRMRPIFQILYDANADVVLSGHDHTYERFGPQTPDGRPDPSRGIRMINVGTGGVPLYEFHTTKANSEQRIGDTWGVLKLTLQPESYQWEYVTTPNGTVRDSGSGVCH